MWQHNGRTIKEGRSWKSDDGIVHPSNWTVWPDSVKKSIGLVQVADPKTWDNKFYWGWDSEEKNLVERKIDDEEATDENGDKRKDENGNQIFIRGLKWNAIQRVKLQAASKLAPTDWYVIKATEVSSYTVPSNITTYRAAVRTASNTIETAITNAANHAAFMALYDVPADSDGNPTGNAPINDWPDEI